MAKRCRNNLLSKKTGLEPKNLGSGFGAGKKGEWGRSGGLILQLEVGETWEILKNICIGALKRKR